jgi:hypothetical protein
MVRSADAGVTWSQIPSSNIQALNAQGGVPSIPYYTASPLFGCIATDGTSNWVALANGWDESVFFNILRTSSDNGVTWTETQISSNFVDINSNTKLFYNNSRYFVTAGASAIDPILYADVGDLSRWTVGTGLTSGDAINGLAFNGYNLLAVGSNGTASACYSSVDNGANWTTLSVEPIPYSGSTQVNTASYAYGIWVVGGTDFFGDMTSAYSSDLVNWTPFGNGLGPGAFTTSVEDESAWLLAGTGTPAPGYTASWESNRNISSYLQGWGAGVLPAVFSKRLTATTVPAAWPVTMTLRMVYDPGFLQWLTPTKTSYINWQFVPIQTIHGSVDLTNISPAAVYLFSYGNIDGLNFSIDDVNRTFDISGTAVTFSDAPQQILVFASYYGNPASYTDIKILPLVLSMRTLIPTVQKQQSGAGAWTYLLRQYTEVNAAATARDNKALPAGEYQLGEFMRPEPPSVITESSNCLC